MKLYVVATPIGHLEDLSPRAARCLEEADVVLAEDTRRARTLLSHLGIAGKRVERLDAEKEARGVAAWITDDDRVLALISDAGAPAVSDPGAALVRAAAERGHAVVPVPGPSAVTTALMAAGFSGERFRFFGFLPRKGTARREALAEIRDTREPCVLFEAPKRIAATLADLAALMPDRAAVVARELTKLHEEFLRGPLSLLASEDRSWRGEITLVLGPGGAPATKMTAEELDARIDELLSEGRRAKEASQELALVSGWTARDVYARINARKERR